MRRLPPSTVLAQVAIADFKLNAISVDELRRRQGVPRAPSRAAIAKADHGDLVRASHASIVLAYIHPRWLRAAVEQALDDGHDIDADWIAARRELGQ